MNFKYVLVLLSLTIAFNNSSHAETKTVVKNSASCAVASMVATTECSNWYQTFPSRKNSVTKVLSEGQNSGKQCSVTIECKVDVLPRVPECKVVDGDEVLGGRPAYGEYNSSSHWVMIDGKPDHWSDGRACYFKQEYDSGEAWHRRHKEALGRCIDLQEQGRCKCLNAVDQDVWPIGLKKEQ